MTPAEQRAAALDAANQVRKDRSKLGSRIKSGDARASRVLADMPDCIKGCGVFTFLCYLPAVGRNRPDPTRGTSRAFVLLRKANCPGHKRIDQLTPGQIERLTRVVAEYETSRHPAERGLA